MLGQAFRRLASLVAARTVQHDDAERLRRNGGVPSSVLRRAQAERAVEVDHVAERLQREVAPLD